MQESLEIIVNINGEVIVAPKGIKGKACTLATREIEKAIGKTVRSTPTDEMTEVEHVKHRR